MGLDPVLVGAVVTVVGIAAAAVYSWYTGRSSEVNLDQDPEPEIEFGDSGGGSSSSSGSSPVSEGAEPGGSASSSPESGDSANEDVAKQADPLPDEVEAKGGLTDVKGVGGTRAEKLKAAGFETPADLYYASDANLTDVKGIGSYTVEQIRSDIGGIDGSDSSSK